jgi:hypothetical protein
MRTTAISIVPAPGSEYESGTPRSAHWKVPPSHEVHASVALGKEVLVEAGVGAEVGAGVVLAVPVEPTGAVEDVDVPTPRPTDALQPASRTSENSAAVVVITRRGACTSPTPLDGPYPAAGTSSTRERAATGEEPTGTP